MRRLEVLLCGEHVRLICCGCSSPLEGCACLLQLHADQRDICCSGAYQTLQRASSTLLFSGRTGFECGKLSASAYKPVGEAPRTLNVFS